MSCPVQRVTYVFRWNRKKLAFEWKGEDSTTINRAVDRRLFLIRPGKRTRVDFRFPPSTTGSK